LRGGRRHSPTGAPGERACSRRPAKAWRRAAGRGLAFAALLAFILAPLNICRLNAHAAVRTEASNAASLALAVGPAARVVLCAHGDDHGGDQIPAPAPSPPDHCPVCQVAHAGAPLPPPEIAAATRSGIFLEAVAPPEIRVAATAAALHPGRPRAPPHPI
jgi:hypothetical protein